MSFVIDTLRSIREQTVAELYAAQTRLADLDASLAVLVRADEELEKSAADALIYEPKGYNHVHYDFAVPEGITPEMMERIRKDLKRAEPKPAKPFSKNITTPLAEDCAPPVAETSEAVAHFGPSVKEGVVVTVPQPVGPPITGTVTKVEGTTLQVAPQGFDPTTLSIYTGDVESQDEVALAPAPRVEAPRPPLGDPDEPKPAKKGGRRTNEELAADAGVDLDDVKAWLGAGQRVSKSAIEEFASIHPAAAVANQTLDESQEEIDGRDGVPTEPDPVVEQAHEEAEPAQPAAAEPAPWDDVDPFAQAAAPAPPPVAEAPAAPSGFEAMETEPFERPF